MLNLSDLPNLITKISHPYLSIIKIGTGLILVGALIYGGVAISDHYSTNRINNLSTQVQQLESQIKTNDLNIARLNGELEKVKEDRVVAVDTAKLAQSRTDELLRKLKITISTNSNSIDIPSLDPAVATLNTLESCRTELEVERIECTNTKQVLLTEIVADRNAINAQATEIKLHEAKDVEQTAEIGSLKQVTTVQSAIITNTNTELTKQVKRKKVYRTTSGVFLVIILVLTL